VVYQHSCYASRACNQKSRNTQLLPTQFIDTETDSVRHEFNNYREQEVGVDISSYVAAVQGQTVIACAT